MYRVARQRHVGEMLDRLQAMNLLAWRWEYDTARSRAIYWVTLPNQQEQRLQTKPVETLVKELCDRNGIVWKPVPPPGGERELETVQAWMAKQEMRLP